MAFFTVIGIICVALFIKYLIDSSKGETHKPSAALNSPKESPLNILAKMYSCQPAQVKEVFKQAVITAAEHEEDNSRIGMLTYINRLKASTEVMAGKQSVNMNCLVKDTPHYLTLSWLDEVSLDILSEMRGCLNENMLWAIGDMRGKDFNRYISLQILSSDKGWDIDCSCRMFCLHIQKLLDSFSSDYSLQLALLGRMKAISEEEMGKQASDMRNELGIEMEQEDTPAGISIRWLRLMEDGVKKLMTEPFLPF